VGFGGTGIIPKLYLSDFFGTAHENSIVSRSRLLQYPARDADAGA